jgi:Zinc knuckle
LTYDRNLGEQELIYYFKRNLSYKLAKEVTRVNCSDWREAVNEIRYIYAQNRVFERTARAKETDGTIKRNDEAPKCYICNKTGHYARNCWEKGNKEQNSSEVKKKKSEVKVVKISDMEMSSSEEETYAKKKENGKKRNLTLYLTIL